MIEYKGYVARIEYDASVERLHGSVINSGPYPIATFEATDVQSLHREFRRSIDDYLAWCEQDGVQPRRPFSGKLNLRLGSDLHQRVALMAEEEGVSLNTWIKQALEVSLSGDHLRASAHH